MPKLEADADADLEAVALAHTASVVAVQALNTTRSTHVLQKAHAGEPFAVLYVPAVHTVHEAPVLAAATLL